ncbi:unnamed protein product, partial [Durusdinium trenchii]
MRASTWSCVDPCSHRTGLLKARAQSQDIGGVHGLGRRHAKLAHSFLMAAALRGHWIRRLKRPQRVWRCSIKDGSVNGPSSEDPLEQTQPKKPQEEQAYFSVVQFMINKGKDACRLPLSDFEEFCTQGNLSPDQVLKTLRFLSKEGEQDDFQTVSITSVEEFVVFCIVCHLQQLETGRMDSGMLGVFLKELLRPAPKLQNYGKLMALVRSHPDKLCVSGAGGSGFVSLRNGSCPSLPTLDHEAQSDGQFQSGEQDIDLEEEEEEEAVNRSSEEQSPCTLLFELANRYLTRRLGGYKGALGTESREQDANVLAKRFSRSVRNHGILRPEVVLAEIDHACSLRKISEDQLFKDRFVGKILAGYVKTLLLVETAIRTSLASQPVLTMHDLEMSVLSHPMFRKARRLEDVSIGKLQFHPLVQKAFGLEQLEVIPKDFPQLSSSELMVKLFSEPIVAPMLGMGSRLSRKRSRSLVDSLMKLAAEYGFSHWNQLGIAIQEGSFLTQLIPMQRDERRKGFALWRGAMGPGGGTPGTDRKLCFTVFPECVAKGCGGCGGWTVFALRALTRHLSSSWARRGSNLSPLGEASGEVCRCQVIVKFV